MIKIENLKSVVAQKKWIFQKPKSVFTLEIPKLEIPKGSIVGIYGENGAGKTTLVELLTGSKTWNSGIITITDEEPLFSAIFQDSQFDDLSIIKILSFFNAANGKLVNLEKILIDFELLDLKNSRFNELSFGQKQRFRFIVALLKPFSILILDEITTGIDARWKRLINNFLQDIIQKNKTVIMISHNEKEIIQFCNRVIYLENGKVIDDFLLQGNKQEKRVVFQNKVKYIKGKKEEKQKWINIF